jgi:hypothetical protein
MNAYKVKVEWYKYLYQLNTKFSISRPVDDALMISGVTRGGTTWLMEMLHTDTTQIIWEPMKYETLSKVKGKQFADDLGIIPYIPEHAEWDEARAYFSSLLSGRIPEQIQELSHPFLLENPFKKNRLLIKLCNANLVLPWLCRNFSIRPIVLVRNPYAVIASQLQHPGYRDIGTKHNLFALNKSVYNDVFTKYERQISAIQNQVSMLANWWAIQHVEILNRPEKEVLWKIVCYEDLVTDTEVQLNSLYKAYSVSKAFDPVKAELPSATAHLFKGEARTYLDSWKKVLTAEQLVSIRKVLDSYGIEQYDT